MIDILIVFLAKYLIILPVAFIIFFWAKSGPRERREIFYLAFLSLPISYIAARCVSHFYFDPRPFVSEGIVPLMAHAADNGFPSDHTLLAASLAALVYVWDKKWGIVLSVTALIIGGARVLAGVHHSVDILGSFVISWIAVWIGKSLAKVYL